MIERTISEFEKLSFFKEKKDFFAGAKDSSSLAASSEVKTLSITFVKANTPSLYSPSWK